MQNKGVMQILVFAFALRGFLYTNMFVSVTQKSRVGGYAPKARGIIFWWNIGFTNLNS